MPTTTTITSRAEKSTVLPSRVKMEQEMMVMRETDQWMAEHYKTRA